MTAEEKNFIFKLVKLPANQDTPLSKLANVVQVKYPHLTTKEIEHQMFRNLCGKD